MSIKFKIYNMPSFRHMIDTLFFIFLYNIIHPKINCFHVTNLKAKSKNYFRELITSQEDELPIILSNNFFYSDVHIGTPPQKISVLLDTGSSFSYFHSASCKYGNSKKSEVNNNFYEGNSKSYSTLKNNTLESLIFKDKDLLGIDGALSSDLLHIGDLSSYIKRENKTNVIDNNNRFNFGLITKIDKANAKSNNLPFYEKDEEIHVYDSSVLGLSFNSDDNFLDNLFKQNFIFRRIFSFYQENYETKINNKINSSSSQSYSKWRFYVGDYPLKLRHIQATPVRVLYQRKC